MEQPPQPTPVTRPQATTHDRPPLGRRLRDALSGLQFGQVVLSVDNGEVIRIERIERHRVFKRSRPEQL
jgi:hypothetical protein